tara:strand:+ start:7737 stop:8657 length:921 start_codon:yes stop_codon:yes gene_type:complete
MVEVASSTLAGPTNPAKEFQKPPGVIQAAFFLPERSAMKVTLDLTLDQRQTAVDALSAASGLPKSRIKDAMTKGACWTFRKGRQLRLRRAKQELDAGTRLLLYYDSAVLERTPPEPTLLADQRRYTVWFKPHGLLTQGSQWGDHCSLLRRVEQSLKRPVFLVHRLDAEAAGLVLIAHDRQAAGALSRRFAERTMSKIYRARVQGIPEPAEQRLDAPLDGKPARTWLRLLRAETDTDTSVLEVRIETGRKHQIRRHLAGIGHPIVGDRVYGTAASVPMQLMAVRLSFTCPLLGRPVDYGLPDEQRLQ